MRSIRKFSFEDRFDRKFRCNTERFVWKMKRINTKLTRRRLKKEILEHGRNESEENSR